MTDHAKSNTIEKPAPLPVLVEAVNVRRDPYWYLALSLLFGIAADVRDKEALFDYLVTAVFAFVALGFAIRFAVVTLWPRKDRRP